MTVSLRLLLTLATAWVAAGCAYRAAAPLPAPVPPASLPAQWQAPLPHGGSVAELSQWWARLEAPELPALVAAAQAASPDLASASARIARARASLAAASGAPQAGMGGNASTGRSAPHAPTASSLMLGVQAQWEVDLFGGVAAGRRAAEAGVQLAQAGWHAARVAVAADTATTYIALRACEAQAEQARLDAQSGNETARLTEASARAGFTAPADAALARASAAQGRAQAVNLQAQCDTLVKALVELTDLPEPALRQRLQPGHARLPQPQAVVPALPAALLEQRPDVAAAALAVQAAVAQVDQARANERPRLVLNGTLGGMAVRSGGRSDQGTIWTLGPVSLSMPLFDSGALAAATTAARAGFDEAVALHQAQVRRAVREVESALVALDATAARQTDALAAARDFEASFRATELRQRGGLASLFELESARRTALAARSALLELQRERVQAWVALYRALGGGWTPASANPA